MRTIFTTDGLPERLRFARWREMIAERVGVPLGQRRLDDRPFSGKIEAMDLGPLSLARLSQGALRTAFAPSRSQQLDRPSVTVQFKVAGTLASAQGDNADRQSPGDIVVFDQRPLVLESDGGSQSYLLSVPRDKLELTLGPTRLYSAMTIPAGQASASLVRTFFHELANVAAAMPPDSAARMAAIGVDLLVASVAERLARDTPKALNGTVLVQRAKAYVEANLGDHDLDPPRLAAAMGVSLRRLQQLFHERGRHISDWIWERRLAIAAEHLADPGRLHLQVGAISYGCGFLNQAHFSRRFRDRYGLTPSDYRRANTGGTPR